MFHSQPVAWVLGETLEAARKGAARVIAEYEALPAILTIEDAIAASSFHSGPVRVTRGDPSVIEKSALQFSGELSIGGQEHFYLETQCAIAWMDETGGVAVECSTQHPSETQDIVARVLGLTRNQVTVECLRMGGAFRRQGSAGQPVGGHCGLGYLEDEAASTCALDACPGYVAHRETSPIFNALSRGIYQGRED